MARDAESEMAWGGFIAPEAGLPGVPAAALAALEDFPAAPMATSTVPCAGIPLMVGLPLVPGRGLQVGHVLHWEDTRALHRGPPLPPASALGPGLTGPALLPVVPRAAAAVPGLRLMVPALPLVVYPTTTGPVPLPGGHAPCAGHPQL